MVAQCNEKVSKPRQVNFVSIRHGGEGAAEDILEYLETRPEIDIVAMGTNAARIGARGLPYLGSCAGKVVLKAKTPVVIAHYDDSFESVMSATDSYLVAPVTAFPQLPNKAANAVL